MGNQINLQKKKRLSESHSSFVITKLTKQKMIEQSRIKHCWLWKYLQSNKDYTIINI